MDFLSRTRLHSVLNGLPKPLADINGEPFLKYQFENWINNGFNDFIISLHYQAELIVNFLDKNRDDLLKNCKIQYIIEETPLGTGGGIRLAMTKCYTSDVLVLNGDSFFDVNITDHFNNHISKQADCSLALRKVFNASRYGTILLGIGNAIETFKEKNNIEQTGLINGGVYILNRKLYLSKTNEAVPFSIEKDFYESRINELHIFGFEYDGYFIDIGIPEDYNKAQTDFKNFKYK